MQLVVGVLALAVALVAPLGAARVVLEGIITLFAAKR